MHIFISFSTENISYVKTLSIYTILVLTICWLDSNTCLCYNFTDDENGSTARKEYKLEPHTIGASKDHTIPSMFCGRNTLNQAIIGVRSTSNVHAGSGRKSQKRSASHMKTLDTNLDVDHSFDFVRTLSAENIKLQEANVRLKEAEAKRVHEHACLQKKVKRMERERIQLLSGLEETGFTEAQIEFVKRKGSAELQEKPDPAAIAEGLQVCII